MKNILLVFTGGTIGSQLENGTIDTRQSAGFKLLQLFSEHDRDPASVRFTTVQPLQILSENLQPQHWQQMINAIEAADLSRFDGIILTHGTDTLAFSAAALALYFNRLQIPMLLVSSDLPLENPAANGLRNFLCAVEFMRQQPDKGVFVAYQNPGQSMQIHLASRLASCLQLSSDFISVQSQAYLRFAQNRFQPLAGYTLGPTTTRPLKANFARVLLIKPYPGLDYSAFDVTGFAAVLHDLYHSGTACVSDAAGQQHSLIEFSRHCQALGRPLYLAPAIHSDAAYSSTRQLLAHGATMIWNMSLEAAYAKLALAYGNFDDPQTIREFLAMNIAQEQIQTPNNC